MGGYGTIRVGMKRPDVFSSLYIMSACCLMNNPSARGQGGNQGTATRGAGPTGGRGAAVPPLPAPTAAAPAPTGNAPTAGARGQGGRGGRAFDAPSARARRRAY